MEMKVLPIFLGLFCFTLTGQAQTYRWINEEGVVSYSQTPPPSQEAELLEAKPGSSSNDSKAREQLDNLRQRLDERRDERQKAKDTAEQAKQEKFRQEKNCLNARTNLRNLEGLGSRMLKSSDGTYHRLTEAERQQRIEAAKEQIRISCPH